jgi:hypothetical protein
MEDSQLVSTDPPIDYRYHNIHHQFQFVVRVPA